VCSGKVNRSCSTSTSCSWRVNLVTNLVIRYYAYNKYIYQLNRYFLIVFNINIWYLLSLNMVLYWCGLGYVPFVVIILRSFHHLWLINWFVARLTRLMTHVEQELLSFPEHTGFWWCSCCSILNFLCKALSFCPFSFRFTTSEYPFGIFKLLYWSIRTLKTPSYRDSLLICITIRYV
jgi:hypothetical protein